MKQYQKSLLRAIVFFICIFIAAILLFFQKQYTHPLPQLYLEDICTDSGFEKYIAYDIFELSDGNPWKEQWHLTRLPVYYNTNYDNQSASYDEKMDIMAEKIKQLQTKIEQFGITGTIKTVYDTEKGRLESDTMTFFIESHTDQIKVVFHTPIALSASEKPKAREEAEKLLLELIDTYKEKFHWQECAPALFSSYSHDGIIQFELWAYEQGDTLEEDLLNYHFHKAWFEIDENANITSILWTNQNLNEKIGNYPIISPQKAKELLLAKSYMTTSPYSFSEDMPIVKTELTYIHHCNSRIFMPYYKFFVQLPAKENGMNVYGTYYVPAIKEQYFKKF